MQLWVKNCWIFISYQEQHARELIAGKDEPYIMGYFESRELDVVSNILQVKLAITYLIIFLVMQEN